MIMQKIDYKQRSIKLPYMNQETVIEEIREFVLDKVLDNHKTGCVIGLSGGIDSATTAALIKKGFDHYNLQQSSIYPDFNNFLELKGYILPSTINTSKDTEDAVKVAKFLGIRYEILPLDQIIDAHKTTNPEVFFQESDYNKGNMISRIRANVLSTKAASENKLVAGTGNKDEDFGVGYYTLFGDGAVHLSPIGDLSKRLVREMAKYLRLSDDIINREPTAGLELGQTDFYDLGYKYDVVELVTEGISQGFKKEELINHEQIKSLVESQIKEHPHPKLLTVDQVVNDIVYRNKLAIAKSEIIHPPIAHVTVEYF